jgi:hypothetical protein
VAGYIHLTAGPSPQAIRSFPRAFGPKTAAPALAPCKIVPQTTGAWADSIRAHHPSSSSPGRRLVLAGQDHNQGGAPAAERGRTTLIVIFAPAIGCPTRGGRSGRSCKRGHLWWSVTAGTARRRVPGQRCDSLASPAAYAGTPPISRPHQRWLPRPCPRARPVADGPARRGRALEDVEIVITTLDNIRLSSGD